MEIALLVAVFAIVGAVVVAYLTRQRPDKNAPPELKEAASAVMRRRCTCGSQLVKDTADGGDMLIFNCIDPECGRRFMVDMSEEEVGK